MLQVTQAILAEETERDSHPHRAEPDRDAEALRTLRPKRPGQQHAQAPEKSVVLTRAGARGEQADREVRVGNIYSPPGGPGLARLLHLFPLPSQDQRNSLDRNSLPRA